MARAAPPASSPAGPVQSRLRRVLGGLSVVAGNLFLLLLALGACGFMTFAALETAQREILSEQFELAGREGATEIESGLRFGRPLDQFLGLDEILGQLKEQVPGASLVFVMGTEAGIIGLPEAAQDPALEAVLRHAVARSARRSGPEAGLASADSAFVSEPGTESDAGEAEAVDIAGTRYFLTPLRDRAGARAGFLVVAVPLEVLAARLDAAVTGSVAFMLAVTGVAAALLAVSAGRLRGAIARQRAARWRWMLFPLLVLLAAQSAYSYDVLQIFRANYTAASVSAADRIATRVEGDLDRLIRLGLSLERLPGLDAQLDTLLQSSGAVSRIEIVDPGGQIRAVAVQEEAGAQGPDGHGPGVLGLAALIPVRDIAPVVRPLNDAAGAPVGEIRAFVDTGSIAEALADQTVDILTVAATSGFFMIEMFIMLQILMRRAAAHAAADPPAAARTGLAQAPPAETVHLVARPVMFGLVFAWALPLSFLPLKMRSLGDTLFGLPPDMTLALPISVEMGSALITAVIAGRLADRLGWHLPFLMGLALSAVGGIGAALAPDGLSFVAARGFTGLGYGLAWMGLQAFVIQHCPEARRGQGLANLMAGILAGFIGGTAVGGILAEQFGHDLVLLSSGGLALVPLAIGAVTMRDLATPGRVADPMRHIEKDSRVSNWAALARSPEFVGVLLLSVVPFSIAQVGLLYFAVPLHIDRIGASPSDTGRILMVYGMVVILLGPMLSAMIDRSRAKAQIMVLGGLIGGLGLGVLYADLQLAGIFLATALLSLSSALIEPARAAFILKQKVVRDVGMASAVGLQRAADKFGQMIGPLLIAAIFTSAEIMQRVAFVGIGFVIASLLLAALMILRGHAGRLPAPTPAPDAGLLGSAHAGEK